MSGVGRIVELKLALRESGWEDADLSLSVLPSYSSIEVVMQLSVPILQ